MATGYGRINIVSLTYKIIQIVVAGVEGLFSVKSGEDMPVPLSHFICRMQRVRAVKMQKKLCKSNKTVVCSNLTNDDDARARTHTDALTRAHTHTSRTFLQTRTHRNTHMRAHRPRMKTRAFVRTHTRVQEVWLSMHHMPRYSAMPSLTTSLTR